MADDTPLSRLPTFTPPHHHGKPLGVVGSPPLSPSSSSPPSSAGYGQYPLPPPGGPSYPQQYPPQYPPHSSYSPQQPYPPQPYAQPYPPSPSQYARPTAPGTPHSQPGNYQLSSYNQQPSGIKHPQSRADDRDSLDDRHDKSKAGRDSTKQLLSERPQVQDASGSYSPQNTQSSFTDSDRRPKGSRWWPAGRWSQIALGFVVFELMVLIVVEAYYIYREDLFFDRTRFNDNDKKKAEFVYQSTFLAAQFFLLAVAWDAVMYVHSGDLTFSMRISITLSPSQKNILQIFALDIYSVGLAGYSLIQYFNWEELEENQKWTTESSMEVMQWTVIGFEIVSTLILFALTYSLYKEFGWDIYRIYGASVEVKKHLRNYHVLLVLLKFTMFFFSIFVVILLILVRRDAEQDRIRTELILGGVGVPLAVGTIVAGWVALKKESKPLMWTFGTGCGVGLVFVVYRLIRMRQAEYKAAYTSSTKYLTFFGVICGLHLILCMIFAVMTSKRFGRGLQKSLKEGRRAIFDEEDPAEIEARKRRNMNLDL
ncbi:hypothetical protein HK097_000565 [Rhizophlyctis rosea]|uniref:Uncharacterized protein n=1 Tax=Rhizophlyctis rosea TaxID=64517 RepID=A0AAD5SMY8_9FUNG|nr:hypothetical protein HK097_000565 [Rhizophlyctis rosea]